ncbi:hypothetical protein QJS04_geneDACA008469 [Acorus gramineus]|uniref:Uncharacterized protein n=1 Tax=Acorus gramineus TaxID=55184 RepID=A0AAV9AHS8_ACOGR|nr:hypothetical protein QJS04_geneDACA008469 [Acorus gramineus]
MAHDFGKPCKRSLENNVHQLFMETLKTTKNYDEFFTVTAINASEVKSKSLCIDR